MSIEIVLDRERVEPGGKISGRVLLTPSDEEAGRKVEMSVLWETAGKGDTDLGVIFHTVLTDGDPASASGEHPFEQQLPMLPVSYAGTLIKVRWLVRVRRLRPLADDLVVERELSVGWYP